jgi:hypothetical protein
MAEEIKIVASAVGFDQVQKGLNNTTTALKTTADQAQKTGQALNSSLKPGAAQAGQSLINLGRIAQDAPFGFIGIQNNINPLLESFQRLKSETGSTGGALKSLVAGLAGPAGLGLAVSVGTALLTTFSSELFSTSKEADVLDASMVQLGTDIKNVNSDFKSFSDQLDNAQKTNAFNITARFGSEFEGQFLQAQANFVVTSEKLVKVEENLTKARELYNQVLLQTPLEPTEEQTKLLDDARKAMTDLIVKQTELYDAREQIAAQNRSLRAEEERRIAAERAAAAKRLKDVEDIDSVIAKLRKSIADQDILARILGTPRFEVIQKDFKLIEGAITTLVEKFNINPSDNRLLKLQIQIGNLESALTPAEIKKFAVKTKEDLQKGLFDELKGIKVLPDDLPLGEGVKNLKDDVVDLGEEIAKAVEEIANNIAAAFGDTLGKALTGEATFGDFFKATFAIVGAGLQELGKQFVIAAGLFAQIKKTIALNPKLAVIAGLALIAVGGVIRNLSSQNAFAVGTRNAPGGMALVGERGPELVNLPRGSQVIPAAQTSNMMGGFGGSVEVFGVLRGQDIFFSNKKYGQTYGRTT